MSATKQSGIYAIENTISKKMYIGSSVNVKKRIAQHFSQLRSKKHNNKHLQASFEKYGEAGFSYRLLEETTQLLEREQHFLDTLKPAYNILPVAGRLTGYKHTKETLEKIRKTKAARPTAAQRRLKRSLAQPRKPVDRISSKGVRTYPSMRSVAKDGFNVSCVSKCCSGKLRSYLGYQWRYAQDSLLAPLH